MTPDPEQDILEHVLLPVAHEADATASARALEPYHPPRVTALYVVEKAGGAPDKLPPAQSVEIAEASFAAIREIFPEASERTAYGRDVVETIFDVAADVDATAIGFRSRGGGRLSRLLSGDHALRLVTRGDRPVIALPTRASEE